jgi:hypothetical protein
VCFIFVIWRNGNLAKWQYGEMTIWRNVGDMAFGEIAIGEMGIWQNGKKLPFCQIWRNGNKPIQHGFDVTFRPGNIDAGPHQAPEDEDGDNEPGLQFINPPDDEMQQ